VIGGIVSGCAAIAFAVSAARTSPRIREVSASMFRALLPTQ
jgi:hypothetical protein